MSGVSGYWKLLASDIPAACRLARLLAEMLKPHQLQDDSRVEVIHITSPAQMTQRECSPSGQVHRFVGRGLWLDHDENANFFRIYLLPEFRIDSPLLPEGMHQLSSAWQEPEWESPLHSQPSFFVSGLISLSAEPPEGFFAASTAAQLSQAGYPLCSSEQANCWLYRVPDARQRSYFDFLYSNPGRESDQSRQGKFLIASGVGPASEPDSPGGQEADLLWLGDEQHGPMLEYLQLLQRPTLRWSDWSGQQGLAQRLPGGTVLLCRVDRSWSLSKDGFSQLPSDPKLYRNIFSTSYDDYLRSLFLPVEPAPDSYLLATSRGCTQGCAICCSGGLKPFQSFSATRMLEELEKIVQDAQGEALIDVFFLDSNFNNAPDRLIEFARLYEESPHYGRFRFFVRHNTVNGFLLPGTRKRPHLALIEAFRRLGIREVFMGVDTFDDHSTLTLKSNRLQMLVKGADTRPTYRSDELYDLVEALEASGAYTKAFYLRNNPWVTDLDRIDSYYNLAELWLDFPHFSIDARYAEVNRLKPFDGSPIERVSRQQRQLVQAGRFVTTTALGELDEILDMSLFGTPQSESPREQVVQAFLAQLSRLRARSEERWLRRRCPESRRVLAKLRQRDQALLSRISPDSPMAAQLRAFAQEWSHLPGVSSLEQRALFQRAAASLFAGLRQELPQSKAAKATSIPLPTSVISLVSQGYRVRASQRPPLPCRVA